VKFKSFHPQLPAFLRPSQRVAWTVENGILALWIFAVFACTLTHELWRDETREYLMAVGIHKFSQYFAFAKYDGHPLLWRTILMAMHWLIPNPVVLEMASLLVGFLTVYLLVRYSPFPLVMKALFAFGVVPFFTNAVEARDYGLSMLFFFCLAIFSTEKEPSPIIIGILLFFEANTNQYGMYMSGIFLAGWLADSGLDAMKKRPYLIGSAIAVMGILISFYSTRVDAESVFAPPDFMAHIQYGHDILKSFVHPGQYIYYILNIPVIYRDIFVVGLVVGLFVVRPFLGIALYFSLVIFNFVAIAFIYPQTHHQGVLYGFIVALYWIALCGIQSKERAGLFKHAKIVYYCVLLGFLLPFMVHDVMINNDIVRQEGRVEKSSAMALGNYIDTNRQLQDAIIVGSPEYMIEPIAYYSKNKIFLAQENCFRDFVKFSRQYQKTTSLIWLLQTAEKLNGKYNVPVLIVLGYFGMHDGKTFPTIYRGNFNTNDIEKFKEKTAKIAEFNGSLGDENYQVFLYLPHEKLVAYRNKYMELR
jgi:hypothetical protein